MNNKGFTIMELLAVLVVISVIFSIVAFFVKGTAASTMTQIDEISNNLIFSAAREYVLEENVGFNSEGYVCVTVQELIEYGYVNKGNNSDEIIKISRDNQTMVITKVEYVTTCE